uniref:Nucleoporin Nup188 N-terminal domain-containing protein n=1 Tax=Timema genevievae TaxID=629358 RepID=A0A7R9JTY0_TIMGE|nr:unnamed protein product [Timema genevievae]
METYEGFVAKMTGEVKQDTCATTNKTQGEDGKDTLISCKQLWRTISGKCYKVTKSTVSKKLDEASLMIQQGLEFYHPPNPSTDVEIHKEISPPIYKILFKLRTFLRLDIKITFQLLQHYLIHTFRGERKELVKYLETEESTQLFMLDFAAFYRSERIHLLQCINIIVTHCGNKKHPLSDCYTDVIEKIPDDILELMFSQLISALNVCTPTLLTHGELMVPAQQQQWCQSYLYELMQIINNLFFCLKGYQTSSFNLLKTLQLCMRNDFGKVLPGGCEKYPALIEIICYLEVMLVLLATGLHTEDLFKLLSNSDALDEVNRIVSAMDQKGAHGVIVMGWAFIKNIIADDEEQKTLAESNLENLYGNFDDVCSFLSQLLSNPIFQEPTELSSIAHDLIYKLLHWIVNHNIRDGLDSQPLYKCVTTALVHPEFKKHFWTEDQDRGLHILLIDSSRKFPVDYLSFSSLIELLSRDEHSIVSNLVKYLRTLPTFTERLTPNLKDVLVKKIDDNTNICTQAHYPLYSNQMIPLGTTGNFSTNDNELIVWDYKFSFFDVILSEIEKLFGEMSYGVQNLQPKTVANVTVSMKILANIVHSGFIVEGDMVLPVEAAIELMAKFTDVLEPPNQLLANCLDIVTYLWMDYRDEMYFKLDVIKFLPHVNSLDISPISCINGKFHCGGNGMLQLLMESQLNWDTGPGVDFINLVRLALALLNMTLRLKTTKDMNYLCPLEAKIMYYPNDKNHLRILHSTVDYIYHTFNPNLPTLAVELMRSFAMV